MTSLQHHGKYLVAFAIYRVQAKPKTGKLSVMAGLKTLCFAALILIAACNNGTDSNALSQDTKYAGLGTDRQLLAQDSGSCVLDRTTDLVWEVKTDLAGLRNWRNTYSWFSPDAAVGELDYRGLRDGGDCEGSECDTWDYVRAVNVVGLCGYWDWRMPSRDELMSISDLRKAKNPPTANLKYFPNMQRGEYWTGFDYSTQHESAWAWNFFYGHDRVDWKKSPKYLRLVRGTGKNLTAVKD